MNTQSETNKTAWEFRAYDFWVMNNGAPEAVAEDMKARPGHYLRRHLKYLGDVNGKKILNPLGSCGRKAVPLALLGAEVTVVDISEQNRRYAEETAKAAGVKLCYVVADFMEWDIGEVRNSFDTAYLEGGILYYFHNMDSLAARLYVLLKPGGRLVLNDFHPIRKIFKDRNPIAVEDDGLALAGDYFDDSLQYGEFAHKRFYPIEEQQAFPECLYRYWTMGEIVTGFAQAGFIIRRLDEGPRYDKHKTLPGEFTLLAEKII